MNLYKVSYECEPHLELKVGEEHIQIPATGMDWPRYNLIMAYSFPMLLEALSVDSQMDRILSIEEVEREITHLPGDDPYTLQQRIAKAKHDLNA